MKPRIVLDNKNDLRIRAKSIEEAINFTKHFLIFTSKPVKLKSFSKEINDNGFIYVGHNFDSLKNEQAMVKIMLNCLVYYFSNSKNNTSLENVKNFVKNGNTELKRSIEQRDEIIDSKEKSHNIFFQQYQNNVRVRLSLFNGQLCYSIIIENLMILPNMNYNRLIIDFVKRINKLESKNDFLTSFHKD
ncbi:hypothetical protein T190611E02C_50117 [Tenacibaculum sp. 190524A05c]|uniref:hypothetical protein n=1 Tax=Tenacibaculum platacis TaxID=3137852 RepID=UPI0031FA7921